MGPQETVISTAACDRPGSEGWPLGGNFCFIVTNPRLSVLKPESQAFNQGLPIWISRSHNWQIIDFTFKSGSKLPHWPPLVMNTLGQLFPRQPGGILSALQAPAQLLPQKAAVECWEKVKWKEPGSCDTRHSAARLLSHNHSISLMMARLSQVAGDPFARYRLDAERQQAGGRLHSQIPVS